MPFGVGRPLLKSTVPTRCSTLGGSLLGSGASLPGSCAKAFPPRRQATTTLSFTKRLLMASSVFLSSLTTDSAGITCLRNVREHPSLVKECLRWSIEPENDFEFPLWIGWHPVGFLALRRLRTEINVHRSVAVFLHLGDLRGTASAIHVLY